MEDDDRVTRVYRPPEPPADDRVTRVVPPAPAPSDAPSNDDRQTRIHPDETQARPAPPPAAPAAPGQRRDWTVGARVLQGQFELLQGLRGGAQARAFRARALDGREVFVKIQINPYGRDDTFAKQIELRPRLLSIQHPNLLRCLAYDIDHGDLCEVYEFVHGEELAAVIARGPLDERLTRQLVGDLAAGLQALHQTVGLMHRDLKPENVMLLQHEGKPCFRIIDYGIVSRIDAGGLTRVAGTVQYSPPERMQRFIENNELARAWDWWSVGSIVQEAIDGRHPYQRLRELFPGEVASRAQRAGGDAHAAEHLFDEIQREGAIERYRMHAGMVEITERNPAAKPWLPLLRGLLTFNRDRRWGYKEVQAFLAGQTVPEYYAERRQREEDTRYDDGEGRTWRTLADYAVALASQAAESPAGADNVAWQKARRLAYKGEFSRYVKDTLHDADLLQRLNRCIWIDSANRDGAQWDAELGTALVLFVLADGAIPRPNICGIALDADYARYTAARLDVQPDSAAEDRLRALVGEPFGTLLRAVAPESARGAAADIAGGLAALHEETERLRYRARQLGVQLPEALLRERPSLLLRLVSTPAGDDVRVIEKEYRQRLGGTTNAALQAIYGAASLAEADALDVKAVRLSLLFLQDNGYETHEATAQRIQAQSRQLRLAEALHRASRRMWLPRFWPLALLLTLLATPPLLLDSAQTLAQSWQPGWGLDELWQALSGPPSREASLLKRAIGALPLQMLLAMAAVLGFAAAWLARHLQRAAIADVAALGQPLPPGVKPRRMARQLAASLVGAPPAEHKGDSYRKRLARLNERVRALPHIDTERYLERPARLPRSSALLGLLAGLLVLPWAAGPLARLVEPAGLLAGTPALRAVAPAVSTATRAEAAGAALTPAQVAQFRFPVQVAQPVELKFGPFSSCRIAVGTEVRTELAVAGPVQTRAWLPPQVCPEVKTRTLSVMVQPLPGKGFNISPSPATALQRPAKPAASLASDAAAR